MAQFQEAKHHEDTVQKQPITHETLKFLAKLQKELNTQDNMCNADPRFWVIMQEEVYPGNETIYDSHAIYDSLTCETITDLKGFADLLEDECGDNVSCTVSPDDDSITVTDENGEVYEVSDLDDALDVLHEIVDEDRFTEQYITYKDTIVSDTLFLTHKACEEHLKAYGYNYKSNAHAYCMTAVRSPEFETLMKILQTTDFTAIEQEYLSPRFKKIRDIGGDESEFAVETNKESVSDFIRQVLQARPDEAGTIHVRLAGWAKEESVKYDKGKIIEEDLRKVNEICNRCAMEKLKIHSITARGGWGIMDYHITIM